MSSTAPTLPRWDMSVIYPGLDSPEFEAALRDFVASIDHLTSLFDRHGVNECEHPGLTDRVVAAFEEVVADYNALLQTAETLGNYIYAFVSTDSRDRVGQARLSDFDRLSVRIVKLGTRFTAWVGSIDVDGLLARSAVARDHEYLLRLAAEEARHLMSPAEEELVAELHLSGGSAWAKLHGNLTSQIMVRVELPGGWRDLPMSVVRNLAYDRDGETRRRAYEAELQAWEANALSIAAALNSIKGESLTLLQRRRWRSALDLALFQNHIDRATLDAMLGAARESFPDFRRYLRAKARLLGHAALPWYDLFAPIGQVHRVWAYDEARAFIEDQFGSYSDRLRAFAERAFAERWIDAEPRPGKQDGAFCMPIRADESRILANYTAAYNGMSTLAHELGHGYHNLNESVRTQLQRGTPATLSETASIFCETIVRNAALQRADLTEQLTILEGALQDSTQVVVDIWSRFLFEERLFEARAIRDLSIEELNALTLDAQRETYGDGLDGDVLHPYMWAAKPHYYSVAGPYYNFPYMFGLLFGLGLYARFEADPEAFKAHYDDLLASTGMADAPTLAARFGIDLRAPDFWRSSLSIIHADIDRFVTLTADWTAGT